jgi:hypothetical protein
LNKIHLLGFNAVTMAGYVVVCVGGSVLTYRFVEIPGKRLLLGKGRRTDRPRAPEFAA